MATTYRPDFSIRTTTTSAVTLSPGDTLIVDAGIALSTWENAAVTGVGFNTITINGVITGLGGVSIVGETITIGASGFVNGADGITTTAKINLENNGYIVGTYEGVLIYGSGKLMNNGYIIAEKFEGSCFAIYLGSSHTDAKIVNTGTIQVKAEGGYAIYSGTSVATDIVRNSGVIKGDVFLGDGDDIFNTSKGRTAGTIDGGRGDDRLIGSKYSDLIIGNAGNDTLTGGKGSDDFRFRLGFGKDVITDFDAKDGGRKQDYLDLPEGMAYTEKSVNGGQDTVLRFGGGQTITLLDVKASDFSDADIHFLA